MFLALCSAVDWSWVTVEVGRCPVVLCRKNQEEGGKGFSRSEGGGERATGLGGDYHWETDDSLLVGDPAFVITQPVHKNLPAGLNLSKSCSGRRECEKGETENEGAWKSISRIMARMKRKGNSLNGRWGNEKRMNTNKYSGIIMKGNKRNIEILKRGWARGSTKEGHKL